MLTRQQQNTLQYIEKFIAENDYSPSLSEVAEGIGIASKGVVHRYVQALIEAGYLRMNSGRHRGLELVPQEEESPMTIPFVGKIAAGQPIEAIENYETIDIGEMLLGPGRFALRVQGDSMIDAGILDGDTVIIRSCNSAHDGDIVVALVDNEEATLKRLKNRGDGTVALIPENSEMQPMIYPANRVSIQGVLVGQLRLY